MKTLRASLAIFLFIYSFLTIASLLDIYKGSEPDLSTEWIILSVFIFLSMVFCIVSLIDSIKKKS